MAKERRSSMLESMTGLSRREAVTEEYKISVEMGIVNHRYLDLSIEIPKKFNYFEAGTHNLLKNYTQQSKVGMLINYEDYTEDKPCLKYDSSLAARYTDYFRKMEEQSGAASDVKVPTSSEMPEVFTMEQAPEDGEYMWKLLSSTIEEATKKFVEARVLEGGNSRDDLIGRLDYMTGLVTEIETRSPELIRQYREKLEDKVQKVLKDNTIDDDRIMTEVATFVDKVCADGGTVRSRSHIEHTREGLLADGNIGRKLGFIT